MSCIWKKKKYGYFGDYKSWEEAERQCRGFGDHSIIDRVIDSTLKVVSGEAAYERDSVAFQEAHYEHNVLSYLLRAYLEKGNRQFTVVDWGGALGSIYFQHRDILRSCIPECQWLVVEQENYVDYGRKKLETDCLHYIGCNEYWERLENREIDFVLVRSTLQYIKDDKDVISCINRIRPQYIMLDRIPVCGSGRICVQKAPEDIYDAEFPVRIYRESDLIRSFSGYCLTEKDFSHVDGEWYVDKVKVSHKFFVFKRESGE